MHDSIRFNKEEGKGIPTNEYDHYYPVRIRDGELGRFLAAAAAAGCRPLASSRETSRQRKPERRGWMLVDVIHFPVPVPLPPVHYSTPELREEKESKDDKLEGWGMDVIDVGVTWEWK